MKSNLSKEQNWLVITSLAIIAILAAGVILIYARSVLIPFVLAVFIFLLVSPVLDYQVLKLKIPRPLAICFTLLIVIIILTSLFLLISEAVQMIVSTATRYNDSFVSLAEKIFLKMKNWGLDINEAGITAGLQKRLPKIAADTFGTAITLASRILFVAIFLFFLLVGRNPNVVRAGIYGTIDSKIRRYIATKTVLSAITGLLVWITLALFGLELAAVFGMLTVLLNFIPNIGSIIATLLPVPIAVAQFQNQWFIVLVLLVPGAIQMTIGNVIEPKLMGQGLQLHPVVILLALAFWGLLWGIIGMFLAVPITAALRIVLMQFETLKPIGLLLAGQLPNSKVS